MRTCKICNICKEIDLFYGGRKTCKGCYHKINKQYIGQWRSDNTARVKETNRQWTQLHTEQKAIKLKKWRQDNSQISKQYLSLYCNNKYKTDADFRLACCLRSRIFKAMSGKIKTGSAIKDLGCSIEDFRRNMFSKFQPGMTWDNYGKWHVDHIRPLSSFNLTDPEQFKQACHYSNLQPLWAIDNLKKSNKMPKPEGE